MLKISSSKPKRIITASLFVIVLIIFAILTIITIAYLSTPLDKNKLISTNLGVQIYDTTYTEMPIYYSSDKKIISTSHLPSHTVNAFIATEDKRFYQHDGYDLKRIVKATLVNLKNQSKSQGASTITQQLIKNTLLSSEKTYSRKLKEIMLAIKTEKQFDKTEILNMYLNSIYFGSNAYGIENASNLYFDKSASELTINESACLAGIIKSPVYYSPINNPDRCFNRKNVVLKLMYDNQYISLDEYNENIVKPIDIKFKKNNYDNSYNQQVILEACELLNIDEKTLLRNELKIYTYLDKAIQQNLEYNLTNSAFKQDKLGMVADNDGKVLAFYGDSYFNLSKIKRNPASTLKPLIIYLPAIATNTISPLTPLLDEPLNTSYNPKNASNKYMGWISARQALAHSSNVCSVKLLEQLGIDTVNEYGNKLNLFNTYQSNPSIALGDIGGGVKILDLARAYSVLQNNGVDKGLTFIDKIEDKKGQVIYQNKGYYNQLFKEEDCMLINDMLITCAKEGTAKRLGELPFAVASKTGTAQINGKNSDLWNIAYTPNHLCLTWCGDATSKGLDNNSSSGFYPTLINKNILSSIYETRDYQNFKFNDNIVKVAIDSIEYDKNHILTLAPSNAMERYLIYDWFKSSNIPTLNSSLYSEPNLNLTVNLTTGGAKISLDYNPIFEYKLYAKTDNAVRFIDEYTAEIYDDKAFKFKQVEYYAIATNKYTKQTFNGNSILVKPEEYLIDILNQNFINQNRQTKTKWYV